MQRGGPDAAGYVVTHLRAVEQHGIRIGDLSPSAKDAAKAVLDNRLSFFAEPIRKVLLGPTSILNYINPF